MKATLDYLLVEDALPAAIITLNRPQQLNPLSTGLMKELTAELERQAARPEVRAIVLKGAGRAFSAGHDLKEMLDRNPSPSPATTAGSPRLESGTGSFARRREWRSPATWAASMRWRCC